MINNNSNLPQNSRRKGTGFTNISKMLEANKSNRLGSTISSGIQGKTADVKQDIQQQSSGFNQDSQSNRIGTSEDKESRQNVLSKFSDQSGFEQNSAFGGVTEDETKSFDKFRSGEYKGPRELDQADYAKTFGQAQNVQQLGEQTRSTGGRESLLSRFAAQPGRQYQKGQRKLDTMLLGQTGGDDLRKARRSTSNAVGNVVEEAQKARQQGQTFTREAQEFAKSTGEQLQGLFDPRKEYLKQASEKFLTDAQTGRQSIFDKLKAEEDLSPSEIESLGLSDEQAEQMKFLMDTSGQEYMSGLNLSGLQFGYDGAWGTDAYSKYDEGIASKMGAFKAQQAEMAAKYEGMSPEEIQSIDPQAFELINKTDEELQSQSEQETRYSQDDSGAYTKDKTVGRSLAGRLGGDNVQQLFDQFGAGPGNWLSDDVARQLGARTSRFGNQTAHIRDAEYSNRGDFEFENYLGKVDPTQIREETVGSSDQVRQINALRQLQGLDSVYDESVAGSASNAAEFNKEAAIQDAFEKYFGDKGLSLDEQTGQIKPQEERSLDDMRKSLGMQADVVSTLFGGLLGDGSDMSDKLVNQLEGTAAEQLLDSPYEIKEGFTNTGQNIAGDVGSEAADYLVNPYTYQADKAIDFGSDQINKFSSSVNDRLSSVAGTVICGELNRQGIMSDELYAKDVEFSKEFQEKRPEVYEGYYVWAKHVAKAMSKSKLITKIVKPLGMAWANHMAGNKSLLGKTIFKLGTPVCYVIGKFIRGVK